MSPLPTRSIVLSSIDAAGTVRAGPLFEIAERAGHSDKAVRDCLARMVRDGLLTKQHGRGRTAEYTATPAGIDELDDDRAWGAFGHRVDAGLEPWDGKWHLIGFEIPERQRAARDALRSTVTELGGAPIQPGLYAHAYPINALVLPVANHLGVADNVSTLTTSDLTIGSATRPTDIAKYVWNLQDTRDAYIALGDRLDVIADAANSTDATDDDLDLAGAMFAASVDFERTLRTDPHLPLELLPHDWPGVIARRNLLRAADAVSRQSRLYAESSVMSAITQEIDRALTETRDEFWRRWAPRLVSNSIRRLPPAARETATGAA